jgi:exosome complex component RRP4
MRTFFEEGDLLVAEVQAFFADGAMSLHTRSLKYGKVQELSHTDKSRKCTNSACCTLAQLRNGLLAVVPPSLIVRLKSHFYSLPSIGVDLVIGLNGYIWISKTIKKVLKADGEEIGFGEESGEGVYSAENEVRFSVALVLVSTVFALSTAAI